MSRRVLVTLTVCGVGVALVLLGGQVPARSAGDKEPAAERPAVAAAPPAATAVKTATSRITAVTVYRNSALVTREVDVPAGPGTHELTVTPLPPTTVNSSLYTEGTPGLRIMSTRFRSRPVLEDTRADVRKLHDELKRLQQSTEKLEADVQAVQANAKSLDKLEGFTAVTTVQATEKGAAFSDSAIALSKHVRETRLETARELVGLRQQMQANREKAEFAERKLKEMSSGIVRTERDAVIVVERVNGEAGKVRLNYLVDAVTWNPQYKLHAGKVAKDPVRLDYFAAVTQHTGEDWSDVRLVLSTAQPTLNAAPPELQTLQVSVVPQGTAVASRPHDTMALEEQVRSLRSKAQKDFNEKKASSGVGLYNTAAALDQSFELFNPEAAMKRGCSLAVREGPTVTYHLSSRLTVPSRPDEQVLEVARIDLAPDYYYKAVPLLTSHVYRQADLTNRSKYVLLPGEATMYADGDFVGQMSLPLVAVGEGFTVGFGVDPQLQVQRQMTDKDRTMQGGNQMLKYDYRILVSSYKTEPVRLQVWDRLPHASNEAVGVHLLKVEPAVSQDALYLREQRPNNLLRWDVTIDPKRSGDKALAINYQFRLELDRRMTISSFQSAGVAGEAPPAAAPAHPLAPVSAAEQTRIQAALAKLSPEDRKLAEVQRFCAIDQESPLGSMGPILKEVIKGQPVFLCCRGCLTEARTHPEETLARFQKLMAGRGGRK
jgi:uncharacterized protein (TIGR02231 family)